MKFKVVLTEVQNQLQKLYFNYCIFIVVYCCKLAYLT